MTITQMKAALLAFGKTLNNKDKDEWWGTNKDIWDDMSKKFLMWCNSNRTMLNIPNTPLETLKEALDKSGVGYTEFKSEEAGRKPGRVYLIPGRYTPTTNRESFFKGLIEANTVIEFEKGRFVGV